MRTFLFALSTLGGLAIATPALAGHYQPATAPTVYHSIYNGARYFFQPATYASGFNNPYYGNQGHQSCNNNSHYNGYNGYNAYNGVRWGQVAHPGLHRGHFKHHRVNRHQAARHSGNGGWFNRFPPHRHPGYWRQGDSDSWRHRHPENGSYQTWNHGNHGDFDRRHHGN